MLGVLVWAVVVGCTVWAEPVESDTTARVHPQVRYLLEREPTVKVWVFLADKGIASPQRYQQALADMSAGYSPKAVERRRLRRTAPGLFDGRDLPVSDEYVRRIMATGVRLGVTSRWVNAVSVWADREQIDAIAGLPIVRKIEPVARGKRLEAIPVLAPTKVDRPTKRGDDLYGLALEQLEQITIPDVHDAGYTGAGVIIGILDTGFQRTHDAFNDAEHPLVVLAEYDFVDDDGNAGPEEGDDPGQQNHGTLILGTIGAYAPGTFMGGAYDASFILAKTEDITQEVPIEEDQYVAGLEFIESEGADLATSSLGYIDWYSQSDLDGLTAVTTIAVNAATDNGLICVTAAGNGGHDGDGSTLLAPADAFDVLACGAVNSSGNIAGFSSKGPTADGRVKPEVLARGVETVTVAYENDTDYVSASGTSLSTPLVASAVALLVQARPDWTVAQIRAALTETASDYVANGTYDPDYIRGYGIIDTHTASQMRLGGGDYDDDGDVDFVDFAGLQLCFNGPDTPHPDVPECRAMDFDGDGDVDHTDFSAFQAALLNP